MDIRTIKTAQEMLSPFKGDGRFQNCVDYDKAIEIITDYHAQFAAAGEAAAVVGDYEKEKLSNFRVMVIERNPEFENKGIKLFYTNLGRVFYNNIDNEWVSRDKYQDVIYPEWWIESRLSTTPAEPAAGLTPEDIKDSLRNSYYKVTGEQPFMSDYAEHLENKIVEHRQYVAVPVQTDTFVWVKASEQSPSPESNEHFVCMIERRSNGKVEVKPAYAQWMYSQWLTEDGWKVIEWLSPAHAVDVKEPLARNK